MALVLRYVSIAHLTMLRVLSGPHEPTQHLAQHFHVPDMNDLSFPPRHTPHRTQYCHLSCNTWRNRWLTWKSDALNNQVFTEPTISSYAQHKCRLEGVGEGCSTFVADLVLQDEKSSKRRVCFMKIARVHHGVARTGKVQVHQNHFHQKKFFHQNQLSSKTTFIKNHFHRKPLSSKTTFIKNHFHPKPLSSKTTFIQNHFHQKPLSSKTTFIRNHFHQKKWNERVGQST